MKSLAIILLTVLATAVNKCSSSDTKTLKKELVIEYDASTRGSQSKVIIKNDSLIVMEEGRTQGVYYHKLSNQDWNALVKEIQKIDRDKISTYKAPTNKRASDAARTSQIRVLHKENVYESNLFDEGHPPSEIKAFVEKVTNLYINSKKERK
jgi:hypothetical protein